MHPAAFEYLKPTDAQAATIENIRAAFKRLAQSVDENVPDGPDKTYIQRTIRTAAMWAATAILRQTNGEPRPPANDEIDRTLPAGFPPDHPAPGDLGSVPL